MSDLSSRLAELRALPAEERPRKLVELGDEFGSESLNGQSESLAKEVVELISGGHGSGRVRLAMGELLARLGDPRLKVPTDDDYWVEVSGDDGAIVIGRYPVTNHEFQQFVDAGGYDEKGYWSDEGWDWREEASDPWPVRAEAESSKPFTLANQPVVGVTLHEAEAYARYAKARLPRVDERVRVIRGAEKRPYPWGAPFGEGNANTMEEVLGRPCAVGLYIHDRTPEGVYDLAGNVAEWTADHIEDGRDHLIHPGAWDQPSLASWAKALTMEPPEARWAGLGFRLARDSG